MPGRRQPQRKVLATLCVTLRVRRGRVNCRHRRRSCDSSARTIARQVRAPCDGPDLQPPGRLTVRAPPAALVSAPDASCRPKRGQPTGGLGPFGNGGASRAERGRALVPRGAGGHTPVRFAPGRRAAGARRGGHEACAGRAPGRLREAATACASAALAAAPHLSLCRRLLGAEAIACCRHRPRSARPPPTAERRRRRRALSGAAPEAPWGPAAGCRAGPRPSLAPVRGPWAPAPRRRLGTGRAPWGGIKRGSAACGVWGSCTGTAQPNRGASCGARRRRHGRALHASPCRPRGASARPTGPRAARRSGPRRRRLRFAGQRRAGDAPSGACGGCGHAAGPGATRLLDGELAAGPRQ
jgi:hypothetical protein